MNFKLGHFISTALPLSIGAESIETSQAWKHTLSSRVHMTQTKIRGQSGNTLSSNHNTVCQTINLSLVFCFHKPRRCLCENIIWNKSCTKSNWSMTFSNYTVNVKRNTVSGDSGFVKQISVSTSGVVVFKNLPSRNWHSSVLYASRQGGRVFPNRNFWASLMLRVADVVWY